MIPEERVHHATCFSGLLFQIHQKVHDFARIRPAVDHISRLYQLGLAADPVVLFINDAGTAENGNHFIETAVYITNSDNPRNTLEVVLRN
jgi:hypothetical protein